jgi:hypothetical protein
MSFIWLPAGTRVHCRMSVGVLIRESCRGVEIHTFFVAVISSLHERRRLLRNLSSVWRGEPSERKHGRCIETYTGCARCKKAMACLEQRRGRTHDDVCLERAQISAAAQTFRYLIESGCSVGEGRNIVLTTRPRPDTTRKGCEQLAACGAGIARLQQLTV